jgi:hypothetical protein
MKKNAIKFSKRTTFLSLIILFIIGCDDEQFFEAERPSGTIWNSVGDIEFSVNDSYKGLFYSNNWTDAQAMAAFRDFVVSDLSDHIPSKLEHSAIFWYPRKFDYETTDSEDEDAWEALYRAVTATNAPLSFLEQKQEAGEDPFPNIGVADKETIKRQMGELYHMRAYTYYILSRLFVPPYNPNGDNSKLTIPLKTTFDETPEAIRNPKIGTVQEIYDQMIADFTKAKELIPVSYSSPGKATTYSAAAMLYRLHWLMGNKSAALEEINFVMDGPFDLSEEPIVAWNRNFEDGIVAKEVIWERAQTISANFSPKLTARMTRAGNYVVNNGGRGDDYIHSWASTMHFSDWASQKIGWMDPVTKEPTAEAIGDLRYQQLYWFLKGNISNDQELYPPDEYEQQYPQEKRNAIWVDKYYRATVGWHSQIPLIRLAELYLSRASLRLANGDVGGATEDINIIRNRAGIGDFIGTLTETDIENERIKEMATEHGDRIFYLVGMQKAIDGNRVDQLGSPVRAIEPPYSDMYAKMPGAEVNFLDNSSGD